MGNEKMTIMFLI